MKKSYSYRRDKESGPQARKIDYRIALVALAIIVLALVVSPVMSLIRVILGLTLVLVLPGYVATRAFFRPDEIDSLERFALSVGLSISLVVLTVMFSNLWLSIPINRISILAEITFICFFFIGVIRLQMNPRFMSAWDAFIGRVTLRHRPERRPLLVLGSLIIFLMAVQYIDFFLSGEDSDVAVTPSVPLITLCNDTVLYPSVVDTLYFDKLAGTVDSRSNVTISIPLVNSLGGEIAFLGYDIEGQRVSPGSSYDITYHWKYLEKMDANYTVFVHITDLKGSIVFQQDHELPVATSLWEPGTIISERYSVKVPSSVPEGYYLIKIGLYDRSSGSRLPFTCGRFIDPANSALIATLNVRKATFGDYYDNTTQALYIDTRANSTSYGSAPSVSEPLLIDYGPLVVLGYDLPDLEPGSKSDVTYYIRMKENTGRYALRTLLTDTRGPGLVTVDTPLDMSVNATLVVLTVPLDLPSSYGRGESVFTFALKDLDTGEYVAGSDSAVVRVPVL